MKKNFYIVYLFYYLTFALYLAAIVLFGYYIKPTPIDPMSSAGQMIQYGVITYLLLSVPGALFLFKKYMKKVSSIEDESLREKAYTKASIVRLLVIALGVVLALAAFYMLGQNMRIQGSNNSFSMLWCAGISLIAQVFCKPNEKKIYLEMNDIREDDPRAGEL